MKEPCAGEGAARIPFAYDTNAAVCASDQLLDTDVSPLLNKLLARFGRTREASLLTHPLKSAKKYLDSQVSYILFEF